MNCRTDSEWEIRASFAWHLKEYRKHHLARNWCEARIAMAHIHGMLTVLSYFNTYQHKLCRRVWNKFYSRLEGNLAERPCIISLLS